MQAVADITEWLQLQEGREVPDLRPVFEQLYAELKRIAQARVAHLPRGQTLGATALVNETFLKLMGAERLSLTGRRHFFTCAALAMRQILVDHARIAHAQKRGADLERVTLGAEDVPAPEIGLVDLDQALEDLHRINADLRELVELRYFAGLTMPQIAELRGVSQRTVARDWERARSLLQVRLSADGF